jgi:hypothetical protein
VAAGVVSVLSSVAGVVAGAGAGGEVSLGLVVADADASVVAVAGVPSVFLLLSFFLKRPLKAFFT